jgi:hypothetical protein
MKNVLDFNKEQIELKQRKKIKEEEEFEKIASKSNQEALNVLVQ